MENNILISVIIPLYNRENTIETCLKGILSSDYINFEIIIIDDGSTDNGLEICNDFARKDGRIRVFHQDNKGVSRARNEGINKVKGKWIAFVDSDDTIRADYFSSLANMLHDIENIDLTFVGHSSADVQTDGTIFIKDANYNGSYKLLQGTPNIIHWLFNDLDPFESGFYSVWNKLFRTDIIRKNNIFFEEDITLTEDQIFVLKYLKYTKTLLYNDTPFYITCNWPIEKRKYSLGGNLRTPEYYIYIQSKNYVAFNDLYSLVPDYGLKKYAVNYILDRPISRILFQYLSVYNFYKYGFRKLHKFVNNSVKPLLLKEYSNIDLVTDSEIKYYVELLLTKPFFYTYISILFKKNLKYYRNRLIGKTKRFFSSL